MLIADLIHQRFGSPYSYMKLDRKGFINLKYELEKEMVTFALKRAKGVKTEAAGIMGVNRATVARMIKFHKIDWDSLKEEINNDSFGGK